MEVALVKDEKYKVKLGFTERELRLIRASLQTSIGRMDKMKEDADDVIISQSLTEIRKEIEDLEKQLYIAQRKIGK